METGHSSPQDTMTRDREAQTEDVQEEQTVQFVWKAISVTALIF